MKRHSMIEKRYLDAHPVTGGKHHFFGYYDKFPWDVTGRYLLALEVPFMDRSPTPKDTAILGTIDTAQGNRWRPFAETLAWNWQQSTMLQWLPSGSVIYNQRQVDVFVAIVHDLDTGETRTLPRPIYTLDREGHWAISLNFARLHQTRPGYGYDGLADPYHDELTPEQDGLFWMDIATGENRLILSLAQLAQIKPQPSMANAKHWVNHVQVNTDSTRFAMLHRWQGPEDQFWHTRLLTAAPDGSDVRIMADFYYVSHYDWYDAKRVVAWSAQEDVGNRYFMYSDNNDGRAIIGEDAFSVDGHCSFSPDRRWMLTDTYPDDQDMRTLILFHMDSGRRIDIGRFYAPPELQGPIRCDLHPRWSRDGRQICIDSAHEGTRQVYVIDVSPVIDDAS